MTREDLPCRSNAPVEPHRVYWKPLKTSLSTLGASEPALFHVAWHSGVCPGSFPARIGIFQAPQPCLWMGGWTRVFGQTAAASHGHGLYPFFVV